MYIYAYIYIYIYYESRKTKSLLVTRQLCWYLNESIPGYNINQRIFKNFETEDEKVQYRLWPSEEKK